MTTSVLERPFGIELMTPAGEIVNGVPQMATGYTTTYVRHENGGSTQKKDDDED